MTLTQRKDVSYLNLISLNNHVTSTKKQHAFTLILYITDTECCYRIINITSDTEITAFC